MTTIFNSPSELEGAVGKHLGVSEWLEIDQARIDKFAMRPATINGFTRIPSVQSSAPLARRSHTGI